jgi:hypothetical protein
MVSMSMPFVTMATYMKLILTALSTLRKKHYDQKPDSRHSVANNDRARGRSWFVFNSEQYTPSSLAHFTEQFNGRPEILFCVPP